VGYSLIAEMTVPELKDAFPEHLKGKRTGAVSFVPWANFLNNYYSTVFTKENTNM